MKEILLSLLGQEQEFQQYTPVLQEFESLHPGYHVKIEPMSWEEAWGKLFNYTIHGEGPQVSEIVSNWSNVLVGMNALRPFRPPEIEKLGGQDAFFPAAWKSTHLSDESAIWSLPFGVNTYGVMYRRDLLAKAGIDEQTAFLTPTSFAETVQCLSDSGVQAPFLMAGDYFHILLLHVIASWVWAMGGDYVSADEHLVLFNRPEARAGIKAWFELYGQIAPPYRALTDDEVNKKFLKGESAILIDDMGNGMRIAEEGIHASPHVRDSLGMAAMPGVPFVGGTNLVVWQHASYGPGGEMLAVELASYLASYQGQRMIRKVVYPLPARKDVLPFLDYPNETIKASVERTLQAGRPHNEVRHWTRIETQLGKTLAEIAKAVLAHPGQDLDAILDEFLSSLEQRLNLTLNS